MTSAEDRNTQSMVTLTVLSENTAGKPGLMGEWGLAVWIEAGGTRVLFDTGWGLALEHNAAHLGIDLAGADVLVLSHGHLDHTGGVPAVLQRSPGVQVFMHPGATIRRFTQPGRPDDQGVGMPAESVSAVGRQGKASFITRPAQIADGVWVTGEIPRRSAIEGPGGMGFLNPEITREDRIPDDFAIWLETAEGSVVLLGCAHSGVINTLEYVSELTEGRPIHALLGGMHLKDAREERIEATIDALIRFDVHLLGPNHCTGSEAIHRMRTACPDRFVDFSGGTRLEFLRKAS